jgi:ubiquinone/menaquinone biosynthesis C-methylase UbiE
VSYVYMKVLESAPKRYNRGMQLLTLGQLEQVRADITAWLKPGDKVLDVGCGTGTLAVLLAHKGCWVTGIDISPAMLAQAAQRAHAEEVEEQVTLRELGAVDLDTAFGASSFDAVVSTLVLSELSDDEISYMLTECRRILRPGGRLLVADEILPSSVLGRLGTFLFRLPFVILAFVLTQNTTHRVAGLGQRIEQAGFESLEDRGYLVGTLRLFVAEKVA